MLPINNYAWSKLGGECAVAMYKNSLILRITMTEKPFPYKKAYSNLKSNFMYHEDLIEILPKIINQKGIINVGGKSQSVFEFAKKNGYVQTIYGRKLFLPEINSKNSQRRKYAERTAINAPVQGSAADIIKIAMIQIDKLLTQNKSRTKMIMQVHDELVFEIFENDIDSEVSNIINIMQDCVKLNLPLAVNYGIDNNWGDAH